jgi:hypothetical protein
MGSVWYFLTVETDYLVPYHTAFDFSYAVLLIPETVSYVIVYTLNVWATAFLHSVSHWQQCVCVHLCLTTGFYVTFM